MNELKQGAYWTDHANQVVWGWVERYHVGIIGWGKHMRVRVDDRNESCEFVPERTCHIEYHYGEWYCHACGQMVGTCDTASILHIDGNAIELWGYCPMCGAKVVEV